MTRFLRFVFIFLFSLISNISFAGIFSDFKTEYYNFGNFATTNTSAPASITATITGGISVCQNDPSPTITFTGSGGTSPYTFKYKINNGPELTVSTVAGNDKAIVQVDTRTPGDLTYTLINISDLTPNSQDLSATTTITVNPFPVVNFSFTDNQCSGSSIQFTSTVNGPCTYAWDFGDGSTSTEANPNHEFSAPGTGTKTFIVKLTVTNTTTGCIQSASKQISLLEAPDPTINSDIESVTFNGQSVFKKCSSAATIITFLNASTTSSTNNGSYKISWGDGSPDFTAATWESTTHSYSLGFWNLTYTITGIHGCSVTKVYKVFVGSNPAGTLIPPGNTDICGNNTITFPISGTENNPPGTTYTITFSDEPTAPITFIHPAPASITHTFTKSSCGYMTPDGMTNSFYAKLVSSNPCGTTAGLVEPIYVSTPPKPSFTVPTDTTCTNTSICITSTTTGSVEITNNGTSSSCETAMRIIWKITPATGFTLASGSLGNDHGSPVQNLWTTGTTSICPVFSVPGSYTITMKAANRCGGGEKDTVICVEAPLVPNFTLNTNEGCAPLSIQTANITNLSKTCKTPAYLWEVTYAAANCGTTSAYTFTSGTNQSSGSPSLQFSNPGTYTLKLTATNTCGSESITKIITVKKAPTVTINSISDYCGSATISPTAIIENCAPTNSGMTYEWSFPGGTPATANTEIPGTITYGSTGNYTVSLKVTNECGIPVTATKTFAVNVVPVATNSSLTQTICSGHQTDLVTLTANPSNATFSWTATATPGITGFAPSGTTDTIPIRTISSTSSSSGTITYAITPKLGNCTGAVASYVITVNPLPHITTHPTSSAVCKDGVATALTVAYINGTGTGTYQWYSNSTNTNIGGTLINGATTDTYIPSTSAIGTLYYYCVISPSGSCSDLFSNPGAVTVNPLLGIQTQPKPSQSICVGGTIATPLTVSYSGGAGTATYQWYSNSSNSNTGGTPIYGATSASYTPPTFSTTGTSYYYVEVTLSGNNCGSKSSDAAEVIVVSDPTPTEQPKATQTLCQGSTPTDLKATATGGVGTYAYQWYKNTTTGTSTQTLIPGATNQTYTPPTATVGTLYYNCLITQPSGPNCSIISDAAEVIIKLAPTFTTQPISSTVCENGNANLLSVSCANGVGTPTYQWYSNTTNATTGGLPISAATNTSFNPPTSTVGITYYYCVISFSSGSCNEISSNPASVTVNSIPVIQTQTTPLQNICVGGTTASPLSVSYSGGAGSPSYQWYSSTTNATGTGTAILGATNPNYTPVPFSTAGTYYFYAEVTLSGSNCNSHYSDITQINVVSDPVVSAQPIQTQTLCQSATPENLTVEVTGGVGTYTYQWYQNATNNTTTGIAISGATSKTYTPSTANIGTSYYYCTILQTNGPGCNVTSETAKLTINVAPTITSHPLSSSICLKEIPATLNAAYINGAGAPQFQWYSNTANSVTGSTLIPGANTANYNPPYSAVGTMYYYCVITLSSGGCNILTSNIAKITINQYPVISSTNSHIGSGTSLIVNPVTAVADTVPTGTTYTWSLPIIAPANSITGASAQASGQALISQTLTNVTKAIATATYTVTPRSGNCDGANFSIVVTIDPPLSPNTTQTNISCFGANNGSIQTNIQGGNPPYTILWSGPNAFASNQPAISDLIPGNYDLKITDNGGLPFSMSYTISEPADITIKTGLKKDISCFGAANGEIDILVSGGTIPYKYTWLKDGLAFATSEDISNLSPGNYSITVTDVNNCDPKTASFTITEPTPLVLNLISQTNLVCYGDSVGTISINAQGGTPIEKSPGIFDYNYSWSGPNGYTSVNKNITHLVAGSYTLTITDNNGCTQNLVMNITQPDEVTIKTTVTPVTCFGANDATIKLDISGGVTPYEIQWSNFGKGLFQDNLSPGDYSVTVVDANGCQKNVDINIHEAQFYIEPITKNVTCFGAHNGSISLNVHGGVAPINLVWLDNATAGSTRNNLAPGTYTAILSDASSCSFTKVFTIIEPLELKLSANIKNAFDCDNQNSGSISLVVSGGSQPYSYAWSNGATTKDLSNIPAGTYIANITDANGCMLSEKFEIIRQLPISLSVDIVPDYNCSTKVIKETCTAQVSGGIPPYQYTWSSGTTKGINNEIMETSQRGIITLGVTDGLGCTQSYTFDLHIPNQGIDFQITNCNDHIYGFHALIPIGLDSDYTYFWDFGDGKTEATQNPEHKFSDAGTYKVNLTLKSSSCTSVYEKYITVEAAPNLVLDKLPIFCTGESILLHVSGADSYHWSDNSSGDSILIKQPGDYFVIGTSKAGCTSTLNFKATNFDSYNYTIQSDKDEITTDNPSVQLWSESITYSDYFWDFGDGKSAQGNNIDHYFDNLRDGYYEIKLKVKNPNGCNEFATKKIWTTNTSTNNVFTPNGDGIDDVFMQGWHIKVYNRNGILLYDGTAGWDGTYKGKSVSNDTYFYIVYISSVSGIKTNTGFITVIR